MMPTEKLHIHDLPQQTVDAVCDRIAGFTVGLFRITNEHGRENLVSIGAGTLVTTAGLHGVLTADHVVAELRSDEPLGMIADYTGKLSRLRFERQHLQVDRIARGSDDSRGPDLGFIRLAPNDIGMLKAQKSFFNIEKRMQRFTQSYIDKQEGFWFCSGLIGEFETSLPPRPGYSSIKGCHGLCGASANPREYHYAEVDYIEIDVSGISKNPELPASFGGMSGGGVWQVPMHRGQDNIIAAQEVILSGVIFYQTALANDARTLRCHGRQTVYQNLPEYFRTQRA